MATMSEIMDGLAALVPGALTQNVYAWPAESVTVPCVVIGYPEEIEFDLTYQRGGDVYQIPVWMVVAKTGSKAARDALSDAVTGVVSIKEAFDGSQSFGSVRVKDAKPEEIAISAVTYVGIKYSVEILS